MRKKFITGLLAVVTCFTISSTSFASSPVITNMGNTTTETSNIVSPHSSSKWVEQYVTYNKLHYPNSSDVPSTYYYDDAPYYGYITLISLVTRTTETDQWWIAKYQGFIYNW
ncbi:hypothetical protein HNR77_001814 [Paenibacillus sp. JGP012]|uniref:hypothetical protein n=1 Tax=Paenibacillus sp. JGP012 TaxID=2735914 RepID=UPI0016111B44|nr:hypothetical protein [Paenibacillus sp. JGP012]MBB6020752.1 hypothetical protein [Paenibacillus sp. JGP012]